MIKTIKNEQFKVIYKDYDEFKKLIVDVVTSYKFKDASPIWMDDGKMFWKWETIYKLFWNKYSEFFSQNTKEKTSELMINALLQTLPWLYANALKLSNSALELLDLEKLFTSVVRRYNETPDTHYVMNETTQGSTPQGSQTTGTFEINDPKEKTTNFTKDKSISISETRDLLSRYKQLEFKNMSGLVYDFINSFEFSSLWTLVSPNKIYTVKGEEGIQGKDGKQGPKGDIGISDGNFKQVTDFPKINIKDIPLYNNLDVLVSFEFPFGFKDVSTHPYAYMNKKYVDSQDKKLSDEISKKSSVIVLKGTISQVKAELNKYKGSNWKPLIVILNVDWLKIDKIDKQDFSNPAFMLDSNDGTAWLIPIYNLTSKSIKINAITIDNGNIVRYKYQSGSTWSFTVEEVKNLKHMSNITKLQEISKGTSDLLANRVGKDLDIAHIGRDYLGTQYYGDQASGDQYYGDHASGNQTYGYGARGNQSYGDGLPSDSTIISIGDITRPYVAHLYGQLTSNNSSNFFTPDEIIKLKKLLSQTEKVSDDDE